MLPHLNVHCAAADAVKEQKLTASTASTSILNIVYKVKIASYQYLITDIGMLSHPRTGISPFSSFHILTTGTFESELILNLCTLKLKCRLHQLHVYITVYSSDGRVV